MFDKGLLDGHRSHFPFLKALKLLHIFKGHLLHEDKAFDKAWLCFEYWLNYIVIGIVILVVIYSC